jgi:hypothetical protein
MCRKIRCDRYCANFFGLHGQLNRPNICKDWREWAIHAGHVIAKPSASSIMCLHFTHCTTVSAELDSATSHLMDDQGTTSCSCSNSSYHAMGPYIWCKRSLCISHTFSMWLHQQLCTLSRIVALDVSAHSRTSRLNTWDKGNKSFELEGFALPWFVPPWSVTVATIGISTYLNRSQAPANDDGHVVSQSRAVGSRSDGSNHVKNCFRSHRSLIVYTRFMYCPYIVHHCYRIFATRARKTYPEHQNKSFSFVENLKKNVNKLEAT